MKFHQISLVFLTTIVVSINASSDIIVRAMKAADGYKRSLVDDEPIIVIEKFMGSIIININSNEHDVDVGADYATTEQDYCPESARWNRCGESYGCTSNRNCSMNQVCCPAGDFDLTCCKSADEVVPATPESALCPESHLGNTCSWEGCTSNNSCLPNEMCCFTSRINKVACCMSISPSIRKIIRSESTSVKTCVIPPGVSLYYFPLSNCTSSSQCPKGTECCNGPVGVSCYDWPTRVPEPGSVCPRGYKSCALTQSGTAGGQVSKKCTAKNYQDICSSTEYCCKVNDSVNACCVERNTQLVWPGR